MLTEWSQVTAQLVCELFVNLEYVHAYATFVCLQQASKTVRTQAHGNHRCLFQVHNNLLSLSVRNYSLVANANPEVVSTYKSTSSQPGRPGASFAAKYGGSLTPHLIYPKQLPLVLAVVKQVPKVYIVRKHTVYELLSASPIVGA